MTRTTEFSPRWGTPAYGKVARKIIIWSVCLDILGILIRVGPVQHYIDTYVPAQGVAINSQEVSTFWYAIIVVFLAPLIEEICFRSWLVRNNFFLLLGIAMLSCTWGVAFASGIDAVVPIVLPGLLILGFFAVLHIFYGGSSERGPSKLLWFASTLSGLTFGLAHLSNYSSLQVPFVMLPLLVAPQLIAGVYLTYARLRLGLGMSLAMHSASNLFIVLLSAISP